MTDDFQSIRDHILSIYPILSDWKDKIDRINKCMKTVNFGIDYVNKYKLARQLIDEYPTWKSSKHIQSLSLVVEKFIQLKTMDQSILEKCDKDISELKSYLTDFQATLVSDILSLLESSISYKDTGPLLLNESCHACVLLLVKLDASQISLSYLLRAGRQFVTSFTALGALPSRQAYYSSISSILNNSSRFMIYDYPLLLKFNIDPQIIHSYLVHPWMQDIEQDLIALWKVYFANINLTQDRQEDLLLFKNLSLVDQDVILSELSSMGNLMITSTILNHQPSPYYTKKWIPSYLDLEEDYLGKTILKAIEIEQVINDPIPIVSSVEDSFYILTKVLKRAHDTLSPQFFPIAMDRLMIFFHKLYIRRYVQSDLPARLKNKLDDDLAIQNEQVQLFINSYSMVDTCFGDVIDLLREFSKNKNNTFEIFINMQKTIHDNVIKKIQECFKWTFCPLLDLLLNQVFTFNNIAHYSSQEENAQTESNSFLKAFFKVYKEYKNQSTHWHTQVQCNIERLSIEHLLLVWESHIYQSSFTILGANLLMDEIRSILHYFIQETGFEDLRSFLFHKILYVGHVLSVEHKDDLIHISQKYAFTTRDAESILSLRIDFQ